MDASQIASVFDNEVIGPQGGFGGHGTVMFWFTVFVIFTAFLVSRGVNKGIETTAKILMPIFFLLLISLSLYSLMSSFGTPITNADGVETNGGAEALAFLFSPDWSALNFKTFSDALGQAFFSIGIGSAIMITYGSYLPRSVNIPQSAILVALTDTFVAIIAIMWVIGASCVLSIKMLTFLDEGLTGPIMLPLSGLLLVLFVGWRLKKAIYTHETLGVPQWLVNLLYFLIRFVAPISVAVILVMSIMGLPDVYAGIFGG